MDPSFSVEQVLHLAAERGNVKQMARLLSKNPIFGVRDETGRTLLHSAAAGGSEEVVDFLLTNHPQLVKRLDQLGDTALHFAARRGSAKVVARILAVATPWLINTKNKAHQAALHVAIFGGFSEVVAMLLPHTSSDTVNSLNVFGNALHFVMNLGQGTIMELLAASPDLITSLVDGRGMTVLHCAASEGRESLVAQLLDIYPSLIHSHNDIGETPLHWAASAGVATLLLAADLQLIHAVDRFGNNALHHAAKFGHSAAIERLHEIEPGLISAVNRDGDTPLHLALKESARMRMSFVPGQEEFVEKLLRLYPEALRIANNKDSTPLSIAYYQCSWTIFRMLQPLCSLDELASKKDLMALVDTHCASLFEVMNDDVVSVVYEYIIDAKEERTPDLLSQMLCSQKEEHSLRRSTKLL